MYRVILFKYVYHKFFEASTPSEPFVSCSLRFVEHYVNAHRFEVVCHLLRSEVLFAATAHEEVFHLAVELLGIGKDASETFFKVESEYRTAERSEIRELIEVWQGDVEALMSAPR